MYPNNWPAHAAEGETAEEGQAPARFKDDMISFFDSLGELHQSVMRAIAVAMGLEERYFDGFVDAKDNTLRLLHYPAVAESVFRANEGTVRAGEHSDYGSLTFLFQDGRGGLQVQSPQGNFVDATPIEGTCVVNAGDLLQQWSNDTIKSTIHRVVEPPVKEGEGGEYPARYSIA